MIIFGFKDNNKRMVPTELPPELPSRRRIMGLRAKEAYQKRPILGGKVTYYRGKRDLL